MSNTVVSVSSAKSLPAGELVHERRTYRRLRTALLRLLLCACCAPAASDAKANVVISTTRAIIDLPHGDTTVRLRNTSLTATLVQVWVDTGDEQSTPDTSNAPFELTPSLFVLEAGQTQTVRLHYDGEPLPDHNERLYWFNMLDVPSREEPAPPPATGSGSESNPESISTSNPSSDTGPAPANAGEPQNELNFVLRTRIKLFLRPSNAPGQALNAPEKLVWTILEGPGSGAELTVTNPTTFHVSCAQLVLLAPQDRVKSLGTRTFAPGETVPFALMPDAADAASTASNAAAAAQKKTTSSNWNEAVCHAINDYGSLDTFRAKVNHSAAAGAANAGN